MSHSWALFSTCPPALKIRSQIASVEDTAAIEAAKGRLQCWAAEETTEALSLEKSKWFFVLDNKIIWHLLRKQKTLWSSLMQAKCHWRKVVKQVLQSSCQVHQVIHNDVSTYVVALVESFLLSSILFVYLRSRSSFPPYCLSIWGFLHTFQYHTGFLIGFLVIKINQIARSNDSDWNAF